MPPLLGEQVGGGVKGQPVHVSPLLFWLKVRRVASLIGYQQIKSFLHQKSHMVAKRVVIDAL